MKKLSIIFLFVFLLSGCAKYSLISPGEQKVGALTVTSKTAWNNVPVKLGPKTTLWTKDGVLLNRLVFFDGITDGKTLFTWHNKELPLPVYREGMLPNELAELVETTIRNYNGGDVEVKTTNLRPQSINGKTGFRFDLNYFDSAGLEKRGEVVSIIEGSKLYMVWFDAAALYYQPKDAGEIKNMFDSLSI